MVSYFIVEIGSDHISMASFRQSGIVFYQLKFKWRADLYQCFNKGTMENEIVLQDFLDPAPRHLKLRICRIYKRTDAMLWFLEKISSVTISVSIGICSLTKWKIHFSVGAPYNCWYIQPIVRAGDLFDHFIWLFVFRNLHFLARMRSSCWVNLVYAHAWLRR